MARDKEKVFNMVVGIDESDLRLKPGMTVNCEYILYESDKNMFVPNNCLLKERGHSYIFLKKGRSVRKVEVQAGAANINHTVITGEVKPGQKLVPFNDVSKFKKSLVMHYAENLNIAKLGLIDHKFRSFLTMLGIIFGTASVIAMVSIGEGAKKQAISKYKDLGINNIIVRDKDLTDPELEAVRMKFSQGLSIKDAEAIREIVPGVSDVAPQSEAKMEAKYADKSSKATVIGITPSILKILNYQTDKGQFLTDDHYQRQLKVCIIGSAVARSLFGYDNPISQSVKLGDQWFEVIGVMQNKALFTETVGELAARDLNNDVYIPLSTFTRRIPRDNQFSSEVKQLTVKLDNSDRLVESAAVIRSILLRRHFNNDDFSNNCSI